MIPDYEKLHLWLSAAQLIFLPVTIWLLKLVGKSLIREFYSTIDTRASKLIELKIVSIKDNLDQLTLKVNQHDKIFSNITERLDLLVHRSAPVAAAGD